MKQYIGTKTVQAEPAWRITEPTGKSFVQVKNPNAVCMADSVRP